MFKFFNFIVLFLEIQEFMVIIRSIQDNAYNQTTQSLKPMNSVTLRTSHHIWNCYITRGHLHVEGNLKLTYYYFASQVSKIGGKWV